MQQFKGTITTSTPKKTPRIFSEVIRVGAYEAHGETRYTRIELYIPTPQRSTDLPGLFLAISNPRGRCFFRFTPEEAQTLKELFSIHLDEAIHSLPEARKIYDIFVETEKQVFEQQKQKNIDSQEIVESDSA